MRATLVMLILLVTGSLTTALIRPALPSPGIESAITYFKSEAPSFANSCQTLQSAVKTIGIHDPRSIATARQKLADCRYAYKKMESFLEYFFTTSARIYNRAPKFEAEEPSMEYQSPIGLQVIESLLYEKITPESKQQLQEQTAAVVSSSTDLVSLLYGLQADDRQLLESLRIELVRIVALDITGYEAPFLKSGIRESYAALQSIDRQLQPYLIKGEPRSDSLRYFLQKALDGLRDHPAFDSFDRLQFLRSAALPLQHQLNLLIRQRGLTLAASPILNYEAKNIFSPDALIPQHFPGAYRTDSATIASGHTLFFDKGLSGNGSRSCATCHAPEKFFTDGLPTSLAIDGHSALPRNAPTLLYCGLQYQQFWDGRAASLEQQIRTVLQNSREMRAPDSVIQHIDTIAKAIAAYVSSLHPMNSAFDKYIETGGPTLTTREINGANLFLGKAQCATCHFIPLFNGLIPPDYTRTEYEVLGTTRTDQFNKPQLSPDSGRFVVYPFPFYKGAFKTPTVRNTAKTAPYMHNGAFHSLQKVLDFYNKGGGEGMGLAIPSQTLSAHPLGLSPREEQDIILFLNTLTDSLPPINK